MDSEVLGSGKAKGGGLDPLHDRDRPDAPHRVRKFGYVALVAGPILWAVTRWVWKAPGAAPWVGGAVVLWGVLSAIAPVASAPLLRGWLFVVKPIGTVVTMIVLGIVYFLVVTPIAWIRKAKDRDPLDIAWRPKPGESAWKRKVLPPPDSPRWYRPF